MAIYVSQAHLVDMYLYTSDHCCENCSILIRIEEKLMSQPSAMFHTGIFKGCGYSSRLWLQFLKDVATVKNGRFARKFSGKSTTNSHFTEIMLSMPI